MFEKILQIKRDDKDMYDVAICDDEVRDREFLKNDICENKKYEGSLRIHEYDSAKTLLEDMERINFSIIFMDVQMAEMDGEQAAEEIRKLDDTVVLVFVTGYAEPTIHSIEVQPYRFIKKNMPDADRKKYIDDSLKKMENMAQMPGIWAKLEQKRINLRPDDIVYMEKNKKFIKVHLSPAAKRRHHVLSEVENDIRIYDRLENLYNILKSYGFGYPHSSYIINFKYIMSCRGEEIKLEGFPDIIFRVSRGKAPEFNKMKRIFMTSKYINRRGR